MSAGAKEPPREAGITHYVCIFTSHISAESDAALTLRESVHCSKGTSGATLVTSLTYTPPDPPSICGIPHKAISLRLLDGTNLFLHVQYKTHIAINREKAPSSVTSIELGCSSYSMTHFPRNLKNLAMSLSAGLASNSKGSAKLAGFPRKTGQLSGISDIMASQQGWR